MAEETNVHMRVAMAEVMGLFAIAFFTFLVAGFGLEFYDTPAAAVAVAIPVGLVVLVAAFVAYLNENLLLTAIFGPLAVFFLAFGGVATTAAAGEGTWFFVFIGVVALIDALISLFQPVKLLPVLLIIAAIGFFTTALWWDGNADMKMVMAALWLIYSLLSFYMAAAIMMLVLKGKQVLPLLIKA